mmetsp:Transcript_66223/g.163089  ORF Transcript_66223/g.163089 Transcript_66223/m.163089 type:complete len:213 (-) Transcript_66223:1361-1999(-)
MMTLVLRGRATFLALPTWQRAWWISAWCKERKRLLSRAKACVTVKPLSTSRCECQRMLPSPSPQALPSLEIFLLCFGCGMVQFLPRHCRRLWILRGACAKASTLGSPISSWSPWTRRCRGTPSRRSRCKPTSCRHNRQTTCTQTSTRSPLRMSTLKRSLHEVSLCPLRLCSRALGTRSCALLLRTSCEGWPAPQCRPAPSHPSRTHKRRLIV